jgi:F0F1-type ATP synthase assembly protein I
LGLEHSLNHSSLVGWIEFFCSVAVAVCGRRLSVMDKEKKTDSDDAASQDDRSATAKAMDKVSLIISACLMLVAPALLGYFVDQWLQAGIAFTLVGFFFGIAAGFWQLYKLVSRSEA